MSPGHHRSPCGLMNLDKPTGMTSREVVDRLARPLKRAKVRAKVGHAGTLDPLASGVLVVAVGSATRLIGHVQRQPKTYRAVILLGARSDTLDADGSIVTNPGAGEPTREAITAALASQVGEIEQLPPAYSALRVDGRRAYDLARAGERVDLAPRRVRIDRCELVAYRWPYLEIEVDCGAGTYIRSIARDVGEMLGVGGLIEALRRTRIGAFRVEDAIAPDPDRLTVESIPGLLLPALAAMAALPRIVLTPEEAADVTRGQPISIRPEAESPSHPIEGALVDADGALLAVAEADPGAGLYRPRRVLAR